MRLTEPGRLHEVLARHGASATKSLGQHFLRSSKVVDAIVERVGNPAAVLEIGPGPGALTERLVSVSPCVIALEIDDDMVRVLQETAPSADVRLVDVLSVDLGDLLRRMPSPRAVVSNMPYGITGALLSRIGDAFQDLDLAVLMMQKEVADRVVAAPGDRIRGSLSVFLQRRFEISPVIKAPAGAFLPPPKVESMVLAFLPRHNVKVDRAFDRVVRVGFSAPRKTLVNNLASGLPIDRAKLAEMLESMGLAPGVRPHQLTLEQWEAVARYTGGDNGRPDQG